MTSLVLVVALVAFLADATAAVFLMLFIAISEWHNERHPDKSAKPRDTARAGRDPQPAPEPDKLPDWEAGQ